MSKELTIIPEYATLNRKHRLFIDNLIMHKFQVNKAYQATYPNSKPTSTNANAYKLIAQDKIQQALNVIVSEGFIMSRFTELATGKNDDISIKALNNLAKIKGMLQDKSPVAVQFNIDTQNTDKELIKIIQGNTSPSE